MRTRGVKVAVVVALLAVVSLLGLAHSPPSSARASFSWCGSSYSKDWVCRWQGQAFFGPQQESLRLLPQRQARPLPRGTHVATSPSGRARLAFRDDANCTVGGGGEWSEVVARWEEVMLRQIRGAYNCISTSSESVKSFCDPNGENCKVKMTSRGAYLAQLAPPPEATASLTESFRRHAQIVVCSGFVRVQVGDEAGGAEAVGRSSGKGRFVITVEERVERTEDETVTPEGSSSISSESSSVDVDVIGTVPGRGRCASSFVQTQEHSVSE